MRTHAHACARARARHDLHLITFVRMYHHSLQYTFEIYDAMQ